MCSSPSSSFVFVSIIIILLRLLGILLLFFVLLTEKKSSFFLFLFGLFEKSSLGFWSFFSEPTKEDLKEEDEKKDLRALLLSLVFDENNMINEVFFVSSYGDLLRLFFSVVVLNALSYYISLLCEMLENITRDDSYF